MKTTVQQIIEKFEHIQKNDCKTLPEHIFFDGVISILQSVYLDIEKTQIMDAYAEGQLIHEELPYQDANDFYNKTYNAKDENFDKPLKYVK